MRFRWQDIRHEPSEDRVAGHRKQVPTRWTSLAYATHHRQLHSCGAGMLGACNGISTNPSEKEFQSLRDASPFQNHGNPSMINAGVVAGEVSEPNAGIFGVARPQCNCSNLDLL